MAKHLTARVGSSTAGMGFPQPVAQPGHGCKIKPTPKNAEILIIFFWGGEGEDALLFLYSSISVLLRMEGQLNEITRCSLAPRAGSEQSGVTQHG